MKMEKLRIAVIGCGRIAAIYQEAFLKLQDEMQLVLAMDKVDERAQSFAAAHPGCEASSAVDLPSFRQILQRVKPDLIHILLPHYLHCEYAVAALESGVSVLTEKPIGISLTDADRMMEAQRASGKQLGVIFQNRYIEGVQEVRRMIQNGELGAVKGAFSTLNWYRPESYYQCDWKGSWEKEGGGVIIDQAIHSIDLVRYLTGLEAVEVQGHTARRVLTNIEVEDEADAAIRLQNGAIYSFFACNYYTTNSPIRVEISCEKGTALLTYDTMEITFADGSRKTIHPEACPNSSGESYWGSFHYYQIRDCYQALREGRPMNWTAQDARNTLEIVLGIYESARVNSVVRLGR